MLKIWGRLTSLNVRKVVWTAQELGLAFERIEAGRQFGVVDTPAYRALNPNGLVPVIEDEGYVLWESNTIIRYLCTRRGAADLFPTELKARFDAERWMDWQQTTLNPAGGEAFRQWIRTAPEQRNQAVIDASVAAMTPLLALLDRHLSTRAFMLGEAFSMADIPIGCDVHRWYGLPQARPSLSHLERWYAAVSTRPAVKGVLDLALA
jgi:glutathione S-transferase